jgi:hypothetical protein
MNAHWQKNKPTKPPSTRQLRRHRYAQTRAKRTRFKPLVSSDEETASDEDENAGGVVGNVKPELRSKHEGFYNGDYRQALKLCKMRVRVLLLTSSLFLYPEHQPILDKILFEGLKEYEAALPPHAPGLDWSTSPSSHFIVTYVHNKVSGKLTAREWAKWSVLGSLVHVANLHTDVGGWLAPTLGGQTNSSGGGETPLQDSHRTRRRVAQ